METNFGFIYIRRNDWYNKYNICKLGKTQNIPDRDTTYITGEVVRGNFYPIFRVDIHLLDEIEKKMQNEFIDYNYYSGGGRELYFIEIIDLIEPFLQNNNYNYYILTETEIHNLIHSNRVNYEKIQNNEFSNKIKPQDFQQEQLNKVSSIFASNNIIRLNWSCGLGKALMGVFIVREMNFSKVLICVPSIYLQNQMEKEILRIYPKKNNILKICGTDKNEIYNFIEKKNGVCKFIISTYNSCYMLNDKIFKFDLKIGDEAHHLVGIENEDIEKSFISFHNIKSKKTLFMTATEKIVENKTEKKCYSMDDETVFGKLLDKKTVCWAVENKKITDYYLLVLKNTEEEVNQIMNATNIDVNCTNKELFISAYMVLKSIKQNNNLTHVAIYTNKTENAELVKKYVDKILETNIIAIDKNELYNNALHSKTENALNDEIEMFKNTKYGIISCVYIFGEGVDLPRLNGVCFAENMESDIRIVQCALRPNRLEQGNPDKKAYIIIPYIDYDDWNNDNQSFNKIRKIVGKLRNVDESIEQKIHILSKQKNETKTIEKMEIITNIINDFHFDENENELLKLKLRLRQSKTLYSKFSEEQDEYNYIRQLNRELNIQSKEEYIEKRLDHKMYIPQPDNYFCNKGVWTDWYDFIGVDTSQFIQSKQNWINFCKKNNVSSMNDYETLCNKYKELPMNPGDFYTHFSNIHNELGLYTKRR